MKKILFIIEDRNNSQFRYRVENVIESLRNSDNWVAECVLKSELDSSRINSYSLVIVERQTAKDNTILKLIRRLKLNRAKVIFDIDDLVFNYSDALLIKKTVSEKSLFYWFGYIWGIRRIAKKVDEFICTNGFLAKKLERSFKKPVKVIRNSLNHEQIVLSEKWVKKKNDRQETEKAMGKSKKFSIGYFSGSPTHVKDFRMIENDLISFLENHDDVILRVVGYMNFSKKMKKMIDAGRVEIIDVVDYLRLQGLMSKVDVNIAPLVINDFTNCKSELKFFEAAIVETTTIASPTYAFKKAIKDGENGFLAQPGEWYEKLEYLYEHPEENRKIAKKAREYALKHYYGKEFLKEVEAAYDYFAK